MCTALVSGWARTCIFTIEAKRSEKEICERQVPAEAILFIDDKPENTLAAEAAGMQAIVYRDHAQFLNEMAARGYGSLLFTAGAALLS